MSDRRHYMFNALAEVDQLVVPLVADVREAFGPEISSRLEICVAEALNNIVKHTKSTSASAMIELVISEHSDSITVEILDPIGPPLLTHAPMPPTSMTSIHWPRADEDWV